MRCVVFILFILPLLCYANGPATHRAPAKQIHEITLKNGLRVIIVEQHRAPVVVTELWYKVGANNEPNGLTGISHALEHMMFEGTKNHPSGEFARLITENGGLFNAATAYDKTYYYEELASNKLALSLKLEADRMQHLTLTKESFKKEMQVVLEERRMRVEDNPQTTTFERFMAATNISNPYHHMPIGWLHDIQQLTRADLRAWYQQYYAPNNATLVIVGDIKTAHALTLVKKYFSGIPRKLIPAIKLRPNQSPLGTRLIKVTLPAKLPLLILGYSVPSINTATVKWEPYALSLLAAILDGSDSARITRDLIRGDAVATDASVGYDPYALYAKQFIFSGIPSQSNDLNTLRNAFDAQIKTLQTTLVKPVTLKQIITQVTAGKIFGQDSLMAQANLLGEMAILKQPLNEQDHYLAMIKKITPEQIRAVAKKYLVPIRLTEAELLPKHVAA